MRSTQLLTQLTLWATTAWAFFPYTPSWMEEEQEARSLHHKERLGSRDGKGVRMELVQRSGQVSYLEAFGVILLFLIQSSDSRLAR
jgi:hypothetical protein